MPSELARQFRAEGGYGPCQTVRSNYRIHDLQIHFHTLRHLRAPLTYYKTSEDILKVKYLLGHKRLDTTGRYVHYQAFRNEEYIVKRPQTKKEEYQLIKTGFEYVRYDEKHRDPVYRKRKKA